MPFHISKIIDYCLKYTASDRGTVIKITIGNNIATLMKPLFVRRRQKQILLLFHALCNTLIISLAEKGKALLESTKY